MKLETRVRYAINEIHFSIGSLGGHKLSGYLHEEEIYNRAMSHLERVLKILTESNDEASK